MREPVTSSVPFRHPGELPRRCWAAGAYSESLRHDAEVLIRALRLTVPLASKGSPMKKRATPTSRRRFIRRLTVGSLAGTAVLSGAARAAQTAASPGVIVHGNEGLKIPATPDGRVITIKIDSEQTPGLRMSMIAEDLPPKAEIRVHLHSNEDEIIFIRMGTGVATLGDREVPVAAGATVYVPRACGTGSGITVRTCSA